MNRIFVNNENVYIKKNKNKTIFKMKQIEEENEESNCMEFNADQTKQK